MPETITEDITLEQARAVIRAHDTRVFDDRVAKARQLIGRCFRTRNSFGGDHAGKWWLYALVTDVDEDGRVMCLSAERMSDATIIIKQGDHHYVESAGWREITAASFWREVGVIRQNAVGMLTSGATTREG